MSKQIRYKITTYRTLQIITETLQITCVINRTCEKDYISIFNIYK